MMRKIIIISVLLLLVPLVAAIPSLDVKTYFYPNGSITIVDVYAVDAEPLVGSTGLPYTVRIKNQQELLFQESFTVQYMILTDPPQQREVVEEHLIIPYMGNVGAVQLLFGDQVMDSFDLSRLCRQNKVCSHPENLMSCPEDCDQDVAVVLPPVPLPEPDYVFIALISVMIFMVVWMILLIRKRRK